MSAQHATGGASRERVRPGIYRRRNADGSTTYELVYRDSDGRQRRETTGSRLREAEARLAQVKADMSRGVRVAPRRTVTVAEAAEVWMAACGHLRPSTVAAYRFSLDCHVLPAFGRRRLDALTPDDVARWVQRATTLAYRVERDRAMHPDTAGGVGRARPSRPYRARTINLALTTLHRVYAHAIRRQGFAGTSPVAALERAERPSDERKAVTVLTPAQLAAVVEHAAPAYRPVIAFMAGTGCRVGEALGLTWDDLDLSQRSARFAMQLDRKGRRAPLKTSNGRRTLDLPGSLVTALAAHKLATLDTTPGALVFPVNWRSVPRALAAACKAAGMPVVSPHALRHAHGSALLAGGEDLAAVSRRLGHGSVAVTAEVYSHMLDDADRRQARRDRLDGLYGASPSASPWIAPGSSNA